MTRRDKWKPRDVVDRYWAYRDEIQIAIATQGLVLPVPYHVTFLLPMPKTWSKKKKTEKVWSPHQQKPDKDNLEKGLLDAFFPENDAHIHDGRCNKVWGEVGAIIVRELDEVALTPEAKDKIQSFVDKC